MDSYENYITTLSEEEDPRAPPLSEEEDPSASPLSEVEYDVVDWFYNMRPLGKASLADVPEYLRDSEMCEFALKWDYKEFAYVPEKLHTPELCLAAVQQNGMAIWGINKKFYTPELCLAAVQQNGCAIGEIYPEFCTPDLYKEALKSFGGSLKGVPPHLLQVLTVGLGMIYIDDDRNVYGFEGGPYAGSTGIPAWVLQTLFSV